MRVLLIDAVCKYGSTGKIVYDLYSQLNAHGHDAAICYGRGPKIKEKNIIKFGYNLETYLHAFLTRITGYTGCFSFFSTLRLIRFVKKFKPDVIHIHELHAYFLNISQFFKFLKKTNIKIVHTLHCSFSYTGKCGHHFDCNKWQTVCEKCPRLKDYVSTLWFDHTKKMFLGKKKALSGFDDLSIVCPSQWLADDASKSFLKEYPVRVIHNGIDISVFHLRETDNLRKELKIDEKEKVILSVAPNLMSDGKGGEWVLSLANQIKSEKIKFIMIGVDDCNIEHPNNVIMFNRINNQEKLALFYSLADLFLICSKMENFPTTCLESQCCGTPICGFDVGGIAETNLSKIKTLFPYGDIESLKKFVLGFIFNNFEKEELSTKAVSMFSKETMLSKYYLLYSRDNLNGQN